MFYFKLAHDVHVLKKCGTKKKTEKKGKTVIDFIFEDLMAPNLNALPKCRNQSRSPEHSGYKS